MTFYFGNSVSSMQTEGGWNEDGKSLSIYDIKPATNSTSDWHVANDNYHHYEEDFTWMQELGLNMYRFQTSWSRVIKEDGSLNEAGLAYYDRFIEALLAREIEPMVCLYHFDMPLRHAKRGGFANKEVVQDFITYGETVMDHFAGKVKYWLTFNEQNIFHNHGSFEIAGAKDGPQTYQQLTQIAQNVMVAHARLTEYLQLNYGRKMGGMIAFNQVYPATPSPEDNQTKRLWDEFTHYCLLDCFSGRSYSQEVVAYIQQLDLTLDVTEEELSAIAACENDFIAFSYYASTTVDAQLIPEGTPPNLYLQFGQKANPYLEATEWGWQIDPLGFYEAMQTMYQRYHLPLFPIENGIGARETWNGVDPIEDDYRIEYHERHLVMLQKARQRGVPILGYLGWGWIDILSSQGDMEKRYGLIYVNRDNHDLKDMRRVPKKSFYWLQSWLKDFREDENQ